jgi:hypothetical protein
MVTIVSHVELKPGTEGEWDRAMHERLRRNGGTRWWRSAASLPDRRLALESAA